MKKIYKTYLICIILFLTLVLSAEERNDLIIKLPNNQVMEFILVEAGTFRMGSPRNEPDRFQNENQHRVTLTNDYYIGKYPVTQAQWLSLMEKNPSHFQGDNRPVDSVSWVDCQNFIEKLNDYTSKNFRLPTEAEWEFAARGGNNSNGYMFSGSDNIDDVAWYIGNSQYQTHPVGLKLPNELGIYDMNGNILEWCNDRYGEYPRGRVVDPTGPESGHYRVLRGGAWNFNAANCRIAHRGNSFPSRGWHFTGFRLVITREP